MGRISLQAPEGLSRSPRESSASTFSQEPTKGAVSGLPRRTEAQAEVKMGPWTLQTSCATRFDWQPASLRHQMVSPAPLQRAREFQLLAENPTKSAIAGLLRLPSNQTANEMRWTHLQSEVDLKQSLIGRHQPPRARWGLKISRSGKRSNCWLGTNVSSSRGPFPPWNRSNPPRDVHQDVPQLT